jgi:hypothetical protein
VPAAAEEQRDLVAVAQSDHAGGVQAAAPVGVDRGAGQGRLPGSFSHQLEDLDRGVIVVQHVPLRRLPDQLRERRSEVQRDGLHDVPLGRGRQRDSQVPLQAFEAVERQSAAVLQQPDHAAGRGIVLRLAGLLGRIRGEDPAAQMAAQLLQPVDLRRQRRLPGDPHEHARGLLVDGPLAAGGTRVAGGERWVRNVDPRGTPVSLGAVAAVTLRGRRLRNVGSHLAGGRLGPGRGVRRPSDLGRPGPRPHHGFGLLRARPEEQLAEPADRGVLVLHQLGHVRVRLEDGADQRGVLLVERSLGAAEDFLQSVAVHFDELQRVSHPAATGQAEERLRRPSPWAGVASHPGSSGAIRRRSCKSPSGLGQAGGPTGRQSAAAPVRVGSPAESRTAS